MDEVRENPRALSIVPEQEGVAEADQEMLEEILEILDVELAELGAMIGVVNSSGWEKIRDFLERAIDAARDELEKNSVRTMEGIAYVRGQIAAYRVLAELKEILLTRKEAIKDRRRETRQSLAAYKNEE